jgi:hypothetical protein
VNSGEPLAIADEHGHTVLTVCEDDSLLIPGIVRACNSHKPLVDALERLIPLLDKVAFRHLDAAGRAAVAAAGAIAVIDQANAALALSKEN